MLSLTAFWLGIGLGASGTYVALKGKDAKELQVGLKFGLPTSQSQVIVISDDFALGYSNRLRVSTWAYEKLTKGSLSGSATRKDHFLQDERIPDVFRSQLSDYRKSGFDRGHLVPAADLKSNQDAMDQSFHLSNIVPQDPFLNRGYWSNIEKLVRSLCNAFDEVHTVTGPLFIPDSDGFVKYRVLGKNHVAVPTHFYKVIAAQRKNSTNVFVGAFCVPNEPISNKSPLRNYIVPVSYIEQFAGHLMFPNLLHVSEKDTAKRSKRQGALCDEVSCELIHQRFKGNPKTGQKQPAENNV